MNCLWKLYNEFIIWILWILLIWIRNFTFPYQMVHYPSYFVNKMTEVQKEKRRLKVLNTQNEFLKFDFNNKKKVKANSNIKLLHLLLHALVINNNNLFIVLRLITLKRVSVFIFWYFLFKYKRKKKLKLETAKDISGENLKKKITIIKFNIALYCREKKKKFYVFRRFLKFYSYPKL